MPQLNKSIKEEFLKSLGKNVKRIRMEQKLTQKELASKINGEVYKISRIERGQYNFGISSTLILAQALNVKFNELLDIEDLDYFINNIWE